MRGAHRLTLKQARKLPAQPQDVPNHAIKGGIEQVSSLAEYGVEIVGAVLSPLGLGLETEVICEDW